MWHYLRYFGTHLLIALCAAGLLLGGGASWLGIAAGVVGWIGLDALSGRAGRLPEFHHPWILDLALHSFVPSVAALCVVFAWYLAPTDLLGIGRGVEALSGHPALAARAANDWLDHIGAVLSFGLAIALGAILTAHELMHRTQDRAAMFSARWLLAMAFNASLEVAHVFGHHRDVGTPRDPATARRGEQVVEEDFTHASTWDEKYKVEYKDLGVEKVTVAGGAFECTKLQRVEKSEYAETVITKWWSKEVPGGLVKLVTKNEYSEAVGEVTEFKVAN